MRDGFPRASKPARHCRHFAPASATRRQYEQSHRLSDVSHVSGSRLFGFRFNFRGVGRSQGEFDNGIGELSDAASALDWLQALTSDARQCWIAGYSFGAWIGMQLLMRRPEISGFISVAPPANLYDFSFLAPCPASGLIVHGAADKIVPKEDIERLVERLQAQKGITIDYDSIKNANHFFDTDMAALEKSVAKYLDRRISEIG